jgi:hypothetical protein
VLLLLLLLLHPPAIEQTHVGNVGVDAQPALVVVVVPPLGSCLVIMLGLGLVTAVGCEVGGELEFVVVVVVGGAGGGGGGGGGLVAVAGFGVACVAGHADA